MACHLLLVPLSARCEVDLSIVSTALIFSIRLEEGIDFLRLGCTAWGC